MALSRLGPAVIKTALHFPTAEIELPLGAAIQAGTIGAAIAREGTAELRMPAPEHSRHQIANLSCYG